MGDTFLSVKLCFTVYRSFHFGGLPCLADRNVFGWKRSHVNCSFVGSAMKSAQIPLDVLINHTSVCDIWRWWSHQSTKGSCYFAFMFLSLVLLFRFWGTRLQGALEVPNQAPLARECRTSKSADQNRHFHTWKEGPDLFRKKCFACPLWIRHSVLSSASLLTDPARPGIFPSLLTKPWNEKPPSLKPQPFQRWSSRGHQRAHCFRWWGMEWRWERQKLSGVRPCSWKFLTPPTPRQ